MHRNLTAKIIGFRVRPIFRDTGNSTDAGEPNWSWNLYQQPNCVPQDFPPNLHPNSHPHLFEHPCLLGPIHQQHFLSNLPMLHDYQISRHPNQTSRFSSCSDFGFWMSHHSILAGLDPSAYHPNPNCPGFSSWNWLLRRLYPNCPGLSSCCLVHRRLPNRSCPDPSFCCLSNLRCSPVSSCCSHSRQSPNHDHHLFFLAHQTTTCPQTNHCHHHPVPKHPHPWTKRHPGDFHQTCPKRPVTLCELPPRHGHSPSQ